MSDESNPSQQEKICTECGKKFAISSQWVYRLNVNGRTLWFCRYNCVRAGEKKLKGAKGRKEKVQSKKPPKERLEEHLIAGAQIVDIARRYDSSIQSVHNWIKSYGLQGIKSNPNPKNDVVHEVPPINCGVDQDLPTSIEAERLHAIPAQDPTGENPDNNLYREDPSQITEATRTDLGESDVVDPDPSENLDEIWQDVRDDLITLDRMYVAEAKKSFRERLQEMLAEVMGV